MMEEQVMVAARGRFAAHAHAKGRDERVHCTPKPIHNACAYSESVSHTSVWAKRRKKRRDKLNISISPSKLHLGRTTINFDVIILHVFASKGLRSTTHIPVVAPSQPANQPTNEPSTPPPNHPTTRPPNHPTTRPTTPPPPPPSRPRLPTPTPRDLQPNSRTPSRPPTPPTLHPPSRPRPHTPTHRPPALPHARTRSRPC